MNNEELEDVYLGFIRLIGEENDGYYRYEFIFTDNHVFDKPFYGLYTCASNSVYIPSNLMKPTDFNGARHWCCPS